MKFLEFVHRWRCVYGRKQIEHAVVHINEVRKRGLGFVACGHDEWQPITANAKISTLSHFGGFNQPNALPAD